MKSFFEFMEQIRNEKILNGDMRMVFEEDQPPAQPQAPGQPPSVPPEQAPEAPPENPGQSNSKDPDSGLEDPAGDEAYQGVLDAIDTAMKSGMLKDFNRKKLEAFLSDDKPAEKPPEADAGAPPEAGAPPGAPPEAGAPPGAPPGTPPPPQLAAAPIGNQGEPTA